MVNKRQLCLVSLVLQLLRADVIVSFDVFQNEQVIDYCTLPVGNPVAEERRSLIRSMWTERIQGTKRNVEVNIASMMFLSLSFSITHKYTCEYTQRQTSFYLNLLDICIQLRLCNFFIIDCNVWFCTWMLLQTCYQVLM